MEVFLLEEQLSDVGLAAAHRNEMLLSWIKIVQY